MNYIVPSEIRKSIIGELVDLNSPTLIITPSSISENLTSFPFKVLTPKNLTQFKEDAKNFKIVILDPEFFYPFSPIFRSSIRGVFDFIKSSTFKEVITVSCSLPVKTIRKFLREVKGSTKSVRVITDFNFGIDVRYCDSKLDILEYYLGKYDDLLIVCRDLDQANFIYNFVTQSGKKSFFMKYTDFDLRKVLLTKYKSCGGIFVIPFEFKVFLKDLEFENVIYVRLPKSIQEFIFDTIYITSKGYTFLISDKDEEIFLKRIKRSLFYRDYYLDFLNFLGFKGDRKFYLENYFHSRISLKSVKYCEDDVCKYLSGRYIKYEEAVDMLIGKGDMYLSRGFGIFRGVDKSEVRSKINLLISNGHLGLKYFYVDGSIIKKLY
ncbi:MAG: hypothetical protein N2712_00145 [Brevinematales bacterium]|nr:hypothetical protein [Brevinematales bacterium]